MRILITGGAGFIGSHITGRLLEDGNDVTVFDDLSTGKRENLDGLTNKKELHILRGDICNFAEIKNALKDIEAVFHEAAYLDFSGSIQRPLYTNAINVNGTLNVLQASLECGVKRVVFASSAAVYAANCPVKKKETMHTGPTNPYGITKLTGEHYLKAFQKHYGLETVALRYFNVYGPKQRVDLKGNYGGVISLFLNRIIRNIPPIIYGDGEQTRDFVSIYDIVEANTLALYTKKGLGEAFNIGSGTALSINQVANSIKNCLGKKQLANIYQPTRIGDIKHGCADISKANKILGFKPDYQFDNGIKDLVDWYSKVVTVSHE